jgi:hypothetical protein
MLKKWTHPQYVLRRMPQEGFDRKYHLFAVACYRIFLKMFDSDGHHLDMAERFAEGEVSDKQMLALPRVRHDREGDLLIIRHPAFKGFRAAWLATGVVMSCSPNKCRIPDVQERCDLMCDLLRDIFGSIPKAEDEPTVEPE